MTLKSGSLLAGTGRSRCLKGARLPASAGLRGRQHHSQAAYPPGCLTLATVRLILTLCSSLWVCGRSSEWKTEKGQGRKSISFLRDRGDGVQCLPNSHTKVQNQLDLWIQTLTYGYTVHKNIPQQWVIIPPIIIVLEVHLTRLEFGLTAAGKD